MPTSKTTTDLVADLCWGAWSELGVSGWGRTHQDWAIDPEPLIVFTASIGTSEPRLRDEAMDWCIRNWRHISQTRLRNILRGRPALASEPWGTFAATVNARAGANWPEATAERSTYRTTGRSTLRPLSEPSLVHLRIRAMFGVSARTEILTYFLLHQRLKVSAQALADATLYTKRNIAEACDSLVLADVLTPKTVGNRFYYSFTDPRALEAFVGSVPVVTPDWSALLRVVRTIWDVGQTAENRSADARSVDVHQAVRSIDDDLVDLGIDKPQRVRGVGVLDEWDQWSSELMTDLASGSYPRPAAERALRPSVSPRRKPAGLE